MAAKAFTYERIVEYLQNRGHALSGGGSSQVAYLATKLDAKHHLEFTEVYNLIGNAPEDTLQVYYVVGLNGHKHYTWIGLPEWEGPSSEEQKAAQAEYNQQPVEDNWELQQRIWELEALNRKAEEDQAAAVDLAQEAQTNYSDALEVMKTLEAENRELQTRLETGIAARVAALQNSLGELQAELDRTRAQLAARDRELATADGQIKRAQTRTDELGSELQELRQNARHHRCEIPGFRRIYRGADGTDVLLDHRLTDGSREVSVSVSPNRSACTINFMQPRVTDPESDAERRHALQNAASDTIS